MSLEGRLVLVRYPRPDLSQGKLRPMLVLQKLPGRYDDWLICMISSSLQQAVPDFDEVLGEEAEDFPSSGLKWPSVIRISRLAVVERSQFLGLLGKISDQRLHRIKTRLVEWLQG